jgi:simple sugar transport system ATP-binding protein
VIAKGCLSPAIARRDATVQRVGEWMSGLWDRENGEARSAAA